jgi:type II secretory pathway component PulK
MFNFNNKRNGSTLVLVIMVFAVLMIFGTFILGFTVTENKQAMYYQNKTQAYYIAKSGADIVEVALISSLNDTDSVSHYNKLLDYYKTPKDVNLQNVDGLVNPVIINVEEIEG